MRYIIIICAAVAFLTITSCVPAAEPDGSEAQSAAYTSLIVDTTGLNVDRAMSPKIQRVDGTEVWGTVKVDYDFLQDHGIVAYARSIEDARKNERAGENPLVIKAVDRAGGNFHCDAVVSDSDAKIILDENAKSHFCDEFKVVFVVDGRL